MITCHKLRRPSTYHSGKRTTKLFPAVGPVGAVNNRATIRPSAPRAVVQGAEGNRRPDAFALQTPHAVVLGSVGVHRPPRASTTHAITARRSPVRTAADTRCCHRSQTLACR